ncbi:tautomerase family protein [Yoonia sp. SDW83-1]|uniref:tautomerase family protein n=1 Tax=Yoonia sp. SDW83-1 TaxID=3366945 RepID=UPI00398C7FC4
MPTIRVTVPQAAWSKDEKAQIVAKLTDGLNAVAADSGKGDIKPYINVHIEETAEGGYAMGGQVVG